MSVYTEVKRDQLVAFLDNYAVGNLKSYMGISDGIENTNYFVTTDKNRFVLTVFEQNGAIELAYFIDVMVFFHQYGIPSAHPVADKRGHYLGELCGKPAALVVRLSGRGINTVATLAQCEAIGDMLGRMHIVGREFHSRRPTERGSAWRHQTANMLLPSLVNKYSTILKDELAFQACYQGLNLPLGLTHSDLFRDNALFEGDELNGIIDFYYACDEYLLYDLAVMVNDWCIGETGLIEESRYQSLMTTYLYQRPLTEPEQVYWNLVLRAAALRFWLSRLQDKLSPREGMLTKLKDPDAFFKILLQHREKPLNLR